MSMFPGPHAQIYYNEAGEPLGWDYPSEPEQCPDCGVIHSGQCFYDPYDNDEEPFEEDLEDMEAEADEGTASE